VQTTVAHRSSPSRRLVVAPPLDCRRRNVFLLLPTVNPSRSPKPMHQWFGLPTGADFDFVLSRRTSEHMTPQKESFLPVPALTQCMIVAFTWSNDGRLSTFLLFSPALNARIVKRLSVLLLLPVYTRFLPERHQLAAVAFRVLR